MSPSADKPGTPLHRVILDQWPDLWRRRELILHKHYLEATRAAGIDVSQAASLDELRDQYFTQVPGAAMPSDYDLDGFERKIIVAVRSIAGWIVWWTGCVPLVCVCWLFRRQIAELPGPDWASATVTVLGMFCAFWAFCALSLLLQTLFVRPFQAFMNWWIGNQ